MIDALLEKLNSLAPLNEALAERVRLVAYTCEYAAGDIIQRDGDTCKRIALVVKGLTRSYYLSDGRDITSRFMEEGNILTSWMSYYTQTPGNEFVEAMEGTTMACIDYRDIQKMYADFPESNVIGRRQAEYAFYLSEQRTQLLRRHTAEEKYDLFLRYHPTLLQRVPLKHIASYLGINEETLSRVRSRYHKTH
jgi:CRP/FNR family transcriptional regulator, anaerobic regulatory protein